MIALDGSTLIIHKQTTTNTFTERRERGGFASKGSVYSLFLIIILLLVITPFSFHCGRRSGTPLERLAIYILWNSGSRCCYLQNNERFKSCVGFGRAKRPTSATFDLLVWLVAAIFMENNDPKGRNYPCWDGVN